MSTTDKLKNPGVRDATIILRSGMYFDYENPTEDTICIEDIAWGLANTCRFGGQSLEFYSVAQHYSMMRPRRTSVISSHRSRQSFLGLKRLKIVSKM